MSSDTFPTITKTSRYKILASHDLNGVTEHPDAMAGEHWHEWEIALIFRKPYSPKLGFGRDEAVIDRAWGSRISMLHKKNLSTLMKLPATAENFALWLLFFWLVSLSKNEANYEVDAVSVTKDNHTVEVERTLRNKRAWLAFEGETA